MRIVYVGAARVLALLWAAVLLPPAAARADDTPRPVIEIVDGALAAGTPEVIRVTEGEHVALRWRADVPTEIHLHGYDLTTEIEPGQEAVLSFDAEATGRYPITLHGHGGDGGHDEATVLHIEIYPR